MSTFDNMVKFLDASWCARDVIVPCLEGPVGIGKTAAVRQHAENVGAKKVVTIIASQILPNEVSGITMPDPGSKTMEIYDHFRLGSLEDGDILFFDELLEADQLVLSACLTLIESRQMMSGKMLPDIQIIAATNPTIKPNMLKENIRQRFVFQSFELDPESVRRYLADTYGIDIGQDLMLKIQTEGNEYNILSPRSMTKMVHWMSKAESKVELMSIAEAINNAWKSTLGTELMKRFMDKVNSPKNQIRTVLKQMYRNYDIKSNGLADLLYNKEEFESTSMTELMEILTKLPEWEEIQEELSQMTIEDDDDMDVRF